MTSTKQINLPITRVLAAGAISGIVSAVIANIYHVIQSNLSATSYTELNLVSITMASLVTNLVGGQVYLGLSRISTRGTTIFIALGIGLAVLSSVPQLIQPLYPGFAAASIPLHLLVGAVAVVLIPWLSKPKA
jgi:hypothetical protein